MKPKQIKKEETGLEFIWSDQTQSFVLYSWLRLHCACAVCKELKTPLHESQPYFQRAIALQTMELVGNYALRITWGDGHKSILAFDRLPKAQNSDAQSEGRVQP